MGENSCQPFGLRPGSRRAVTRSRIGATRSRGPLAACDREAHRRRIVQAPIPCASSGSHPRGAPVPPCDAPRLRGCDREGARESRGWARLRPAPGSHPSTHRLEPAPPSAGHFVGRLVDIRDIDCAVLRVRTVARSRGPIGDATAKVRVGTANSVRLTSRSGVASKHETLGTCSALRGTHNPGRNAHVPHYVRGSKP